MKLLRHFSRGILLAGLAGFFVGLLVLFGLRFALLSNPSVHHHANFALYINGERDEFKSFTFYEEIQSCSGDELNNPKARVHMHEQINSVVHVHDNAATWGHFFANLGYQLGNDFIKTDDGLYGDSRGKQLKFMLNGTEVDAVANRPISSGDVLLVSYGSDDKALRRQYDSITKDAGEYNNRQDPAACAGAHELTLGERLKRTFNLSR